MKILNKLNPELPINLTDFIIEGQYDRGDSGIIDYDTLYDYLWNRDNEIIDLLEEMKSTSRWNGETESAKKEDKRDKRHDDLLERAIKKIKELKLK